MFSKSNFFKKLTSKMNPIARKIFWIQIKQCTRKVKVKGKNDCSVYYETEPKVL